MANENIKKPKFIIVKLSTYEALQVSRGNLKTNYEIAKSKLKDFEKYKSYYNSKIRSLEEEIIESGREQRAKAGAYARLLKGKEKRMEEIRVLKREKREWKNRCLRTERQLDKFKDLYKRSKEELKNIKAEVKP